MKPSESKRWEIWKTSPTNYWLEAAAGRQSMKGFQECVSAFTATREQAEQIFNLYKVG